MSAPTLRGQFIALQNVLYALMLRDIQTRFGSAPGFVIAIAWPLSHILILVLIYVLTGRVVPYGDSAVLWFSIGLTPFMIISYTSRFMMLGLVVNRPLLQFPVISILGVLFSRVLIELFVTSCVCVSLVLIFLYLDIDWMPARPGAAAAAFLVSVALGTGLGIINGVIALAWEKWATVYALLLILLWLTSGAYFLPSALPGPLRDLLYFHPAVHCIEWARYAWYENYTSLILDREYVIGFTVLTIFIGLGLERLLRGRLMYV